MSSCFSGLTREMGMVLAFPFPLSESAPYFDHCRESGVPVFCNRIQEIFLCGRPWIADMKIKTVNCLLVGCNNKHDPHAGSSVSSCFPASVEQHSAWFFYEEFLLWQKFCIGNTCNDKGVWTQACRTISGNIMPIFPRHGLHFLISTQRPLAIGRGELR